MMRRLRRALARSWLLSKVYYRLCGLRIAGRPADKVWYFAFGANMHDSAFRGRRGMRPSEWRVGRAPGYRLRFNLDGRPLGKAAPAVIEEARQKALPGRATTESAATESVDAKADESTESVSGEGAESESG